MIINNTLHSTYKGSHPNSPRFKGPGQEHGRVYSGVSQNTTVQECDKINVNTSANKTTAGENPSGRLSFKGGAKVGTQIAEKLAKNGAFNKFLDIISSNSLIADGIIALFLTSVLRPLSIFIIPAKDEAEKKKNNSQVAHSIATGILGLGMTFAVAEPLKRGVMKVIKNPAKYMKTDGAYTKERVFKETATRLHQPLFLPIRAMLTIAIIKPILKGLGLNKAQDELPPATKAKIEYSMMSFKGDETNNKAFQNFAGVSAAMAAGAAARNINNTKNFKANPSFKGLPGAAVTEGIAKGVGKIADTNGFRRFVNWLGEKKQWFPHLIAAESLLLSGFYMQQTAASKRIEKDQKPAMIINQGITAIACTAGAYIIDGKVNKMLDKFKVIYKKANPQMSEELLAKRQQAIRLLGPLVIYTTIYRFVGPVILTPVANYISEKLPKKADKAA